jgi:hypothetical protein
MVPDKSTGAHHCVSLQSDAGTVLNTADYKDRLASFCIIPKQLIFIGILINSRVSRYALCRALVSAMPWFGMRYAVPVCAMPCRPVCAMPWFCG